MRAAQHPLQGKVLLHGVKSRFSKYLSNAVLLALASLLATCGGEEATTAPPTPPAPPTVASVVVTPAADTLISLGETVQLGASARDANGNVLSGKTFSWSSSNEEIATVSSSGLVTGVKDGSATITATTDGVAGTADIEVVLKLSETIEGEFRVNNFVVEADQSHRVVGDLIVIADSSIRIDGTLEIEAGNDVGLFAHGELTVSGSITSAANGSALGAAPAGSALRTEDDPPDRLVVAAGNASIPGAFNLHGADLFIVALFRPEGADETSLVLNIDGRIELNPNLAIPQGLPSAAIEIGTDAAVDAAKELFPAGNFREFNDIELNPGAEIVTGNGTDAPDVLRGTQDGTAFTLDEPTDGDPAGRISIQSIDSIIIDGATLKAGGGGGGSGIGTNGSPINFPEVDLIKLVTGNGGTGGSIVVNSVEVTIRNSVVSPGPGGPAGSVGSADSPVQVPDATGKVDVATGVGGDAGDFVYSGPSRGLELEGNFVVPAVGSPASGFLTGGNGLPGQPGADVTLEIGGAGEPGSVPDGSDADSTNFEPRVWNWKLSEFGNGGNSPAQGEPGANGGDFEFDALYDALTKAFNADTIELEDSFNGGDGWNGCDTLPPTNGTDGGTSGSVQLTINGQSPDTNITISLDSALLGGTGGDGFPNGGFGGEADSLGGPGLPGAPCPGVKGEDMFRRWDFDAVNPDGSGSGNFTRNALPSWAFDTLLILGDGFRPPFVGSYDPLTGEWNGTAETQFAGDLTLTETQKGNFLDLDTLYFVGTLSIKVQIPGLPTDSTLWNVTGVSPDSLTPDCNLRFLPPGEKWHTVVHRQSSCPANNGFAVSFSIPGDSVFGTRLALQGDSSGNLKLGLYDQTTGQLLAETPNAVSDSTLWIPPDTVTLTAKVVSRDQQAHPVALSSNPVSGQGEECRPWVATKDGFTSEDFGAGVRFIDLSDCEFVEGSGKLSETVLVQLNVGDSIFIRVVGKNPVVELYDQDKNRVAQSVGESFEGQEDATLEFEATSSGTYTINFTTMLPGQNDVQIWSAFVTRAGS